MYEVAEINRATAVGYDRLLGALLVVDPLPAWSMNRRHLVWLRDHLAAQIASLWS